MSKKVSKVAVTACWGHWSFGMKDFRPPDRSQCRQRKFGFFVDSLIRQKLPEIEENFAFTKGANLWTALRLGNGKCVLYVKPRDEFACIQCITSTFQGLWEKWLCASVWNSGQSQPQQGKIAAWTIMDSEVLVCDVCVVFTAQVLTFQTPLVLAVFLYFLWIRPGKPSNGKQTAAVKSGFGTWKHTNWDLELGKPGSHEFASFVVMPLFSHSE